MSSEDAIVTRIRDAGSLLAAREYLLDAVLPLDWLTHDETQSLFEAILLLPDKRLSRYKKLGLLFWRRTTPFRRWKLLFHAVRSVEYRFETGSMRTGDFSIGDITYDWDRSLSIVTHEGLAIRVGMNRLQGELIRCAEIDPQRILRTIVVGFFRPPGEVNISGFK